MAEAILNNLSEGKHKASSVGTYVIRGDDTTREGQKLKDHPDMNVIAAMHEIGIDISENQRTQLTPEILEKADKAVVMAQPEFVPEYLSRSQKTIFWKVEDPYEKSLAFTRNVRDQIKNLVKDLLISLG